jgi:hypothetical protein
MVAVVHIEPCDFINHEAWPDLRERAIRYLPAIAIMPVGTLICGGWVRDYVSQSAPKDMDLFFQTEAQFERATKIMSTLDSWECLYRGRNVWAYKCGDKEVQLIKHLIGSPDEILAGFDFLVCCWAFDYRKNRVWTHRIAPECLGARSLKLLGWTDPLRTLSRMARFVKRGFKVEAESFAKLVRAIIEAGDPFTPPTFIPAIIDDVTAEDEFWRQQEAEWEWDQRQRDEARFWEDWDREQERRHQSATELDPLDDYPQPRRVR